MQTAESVFASRHAGATALGKLHLVSLAAPEEAEREGDRSLPALSTCLQVSCHTAYESCQIPEGDTRHRNTLLPLHKYAGDLYSVR